VAFNTVAQAQESAVLDPVVAPTEYLSRYVSQPDAEFAWSLEETIPTPLGKVYRLHLVSQKWQEIVWEHSLMVYEPEKLVFPNQMLLFVTGSSTGKIPQAKEYPLGLQLAQLTGARVAMLYQVPNQPLLGDRKEDDLISETWLKYLETGDPSWPMLFPMVKSAMRAMDALQAFAKADLETDVDAFVITGASKRGWTSWLTPAADSRVIGTAPMVIDVLNFPKQMKHQKETWGFYSEQIADYTSKGLVHDTGIPLTGPEGDLWKMMDPHSYLDRIAIPKLLIVGANDRYWSVDAMSLYWNDIQGPKAQHRVANAGHNLDNGGDGRLNALTTLAVFFRMTVRGEQLPQISWELPAGDTSLSLTMKSPVAPQSARLWSCTSATNDFRESKWGAKRLTAQEGIFSGTVSIPENEHLAIYGELVFQYEDLKYSLTTLVNWK